MRTLQAPVHRQVALGPAFVGAVVVAVVVALAGCALGPVAQGRRAMDDGAYEIAARHFREAAEASPGDPDRWAELGRSELRAERPVRARGAFERLAGLRPQAAGPRILIGLTWEMQRRYEEAALAYEQAREVDPTDARAHRILGSRLLRWGEPEGAVEPLRQAVALEPGHAETHNALGLALYQLGDEAGAAQTFRKGIALHPDHRGLRLGLAALLVNSRRYREALAVYDAVLERSPSFAAAHVGRAILLHELGRPREAEAAFEAAVEVARDPRPYRARLEGYRALLRQGPLLRQGQGASDQGAGEPAGGR